MTTRKELINYSEQVINGQIIACQKHKWACQRFLRDLEHEGTEEFPFLFEEAKAKRFLDWMRLFKHTKGKLAGEYIEPHIIQKFNFGNIYGWVHQKTGLRRFRKVYWQVGRKNAKSQSLACGGSYEASALGELMSEVYIGATKAEQSKIVWKEIKAQLSQCPELKGRFKVAYGKIQHLKSDSFITALSKDAGKTGDGFHVQTGIVDEYHAHKTSEIYDVLVSGMGARSQPLMIIITTAGFDLNNPCYKVEYKYVSQILEPDNPIENEQYFVMINELDVNEQGELLDDIKDVRVWEKANPIICSYPEGIEYLKGELQAALDVPLKMRNFLTKNMNVWINQREHGYMQMNKWSACKAQLPDLGGLECYLGIDLSSKIDLTSVAFEFILPDGKIAIFSHSFMPEDTITAKLKTDKVPYDSWVKQGWITATPGAVVDYNFVKEYIDQIVTENKWRVKEVCFDPWNASQFANEMTSSGYNCLEIIQGMRTLSEPTKHLRELVYQKKVIHDGNPVLAWAMGNTVIRQDHNENIMLDKAKSSERIDPVAALLNAHTRAIVNEPRLDLSEFTTMEFLQKLWG